MIRPAVAADLPRIFEIRNGVGENRFTDPAAVTERAAARSLADGTMWVWEEPGAPAAGFAAVDPREGTIWALFVAHGQGGKGIGRALLDTVCEALRQAGHPAARISVKVASSAERHFRAAGWAEMGVDEKGERVFQKPL